jgi:hypothetical protein
MPADTVADWHHEPMVMYDDMTEDEQAAVRERADSLAKMRRDEIESMIAENKVNAAGAIDVTHVPPIDYSGVWSAVYPNRLKAIVEVECEYLEKIGHTDETGVLVKYKRRWMSSVGPMWDVFIVSRTKDKIHISRDLRRFPVGIQGAIDEIENYMKSK